LAGHIEEEERRSRRDRKVPALNAGEDAGNWRRRWALGTIERRRRKERNRINLKQSLCEHILGFSLDPPYFGTYKLVSS
jgi:hypothetical protein